MDSLPFTILANIFRFIADSPDTFSQTCSLFYSVAKDPINTADYLVEKYGRPSALFFAITKHPKLLNEHVATALLRKGAMLPRYLGQRLLQGFAVERKLPLKTVRFLLQTASDMYGEFDVAEDDWRTAHEFLNQLLWAKRVSTPVSDTLISDFEAFIRDTQFMPFPFPQSPRAHTLIYYNPSFERLITSLQLYTPHILQSMIAKGLNLRCIDTSRFVVSFISYALNADHTAHSAGDALQALLAHNVISITPDVIRAVFSRMNDDICWQQIESLKRLHLSFDYAPIAQQVVTSIFSDPLQRDETMKDFPYVALYHHWPCPDAVSYCIRQLYSVPVGAPNLDNFTFHLRPRTCEWVCETLGPHHLATRVCFDNVVLALANPHSVPYYAEDPPPRILSLFNRYVVEGVRITGRHVAWFAECRRQSSVRYFLEAVKEHGVSEEDAADELIPPTGPPSTPSSSRPKRTRATTIPTTPTSRKRKQPDSLPNSGGSSSPAWQQLLQQLLRDEERKREDRASALRTTRRRKPQVAQTMFHRTLEEFLEEERTGKKSRACGICGAVHV